MSMMNPTSETSAAADHCSVPSIRELMEEVKRKQGNVPPFTKPVPNNIASSKWTKEEITPIPEIILSAPSIREMLEEKKRNEGGASTSAKPVPNNADPSKWTKGEIKPITDSPMSTQEDAARKAAIKELEKTLCSGKPLQLNPDGSVSILDKKPPSPKPVPSHNDTDKWSKGEIKPITDSPMSEPSIREMLEEKKRNEGGASTSAKPVPNNADSSKWTKGEIKPITDSPMSTLQWYHRDPDLYAYEVSQIQKMYPSAEPLYLDDGRLCFDLIITAFEDNLYEPAEHPCFCVFDANHPHADYGGSFKIYPQDVDELESVFISSPVVQAYCKEAGEDLCLPHIIKDYSTGARYLCSIAPEKTGNSLDTGIVDAEASINRARLFFTYVEGAVFSKAICKKLFSHK